MGFLSQFSNQYSYLLFSLAGIAFVLVILRILRARRAVVIGVTVLVVAAAVGGWLILRPGSSDVANLAAAEAIITNGNPTFVEFFSNYCAGCMAARGTVDTLVDQMRNQFANDFNVLRVDIHTELGRVLRERYGFSYTPEFVIFDDGGNEVWRSHVPPSIQELETIATSSG